MKRFNWLLVGLVVLCLAMIPLTGCISKTEHEALQAEYATVVQENTTLKAELEGVQSDLTKAQAGYDTLKGDHDKLGADYDTLKGDHDKLSADHDKLSADHDTLKGDHDKLSTDHDTLKGDHDKLSTDYDTLKGDYDKLSADYDELSTACVELSSVCEAASDELAEIKEVYPARDFSSLQELKDWLLANDVSERPPATVAEILYSKALEIQEDALKDGYIISAWIDYYSETQLFYVNCTAVIDGNVWFWDPQTDEPIDFSGATGLLKVQ